MHSQQIRTLQQQIVEHVVELVSDEWEFVLVNLEVADVDGQLAKSCLSASFKIRNECWIATDFRFQPDTYYAFLTLRELMATTPENTWGTCTLEIMADGRFRYTFDYEPPRRLNGVLDDVSLFKDYVPQPW